MTPRSPVHPSPNLRRTAGQMLAAIERGRTLDRAIATLAHLPVADRRFAHLIVLTALRRRGEITAQLETYIKKPIPPRPHIANALLHIGVAQLVYLGVAPHAAINETIAAMGAREKPYRGLANAVLRKIATAPKPTPDALKNLPDWLATRWRDHYGADATRAIAELFCDTPPTDLCFASARDTQDWLAKYATDYNAHALTPTQIRLPQAGDITALPEYATGIWWVQDVAAALAAPLLRVQKGEAVLDLCAAPGGKTTQLACLGARATALDNAPKRLDILRENLHRTKQHADIVCADLLAWDAPQTYSAILLDAPCTATGTLRRNPDIALHRHAGDIAHCASRQDAMLDRAAELLAPNGRLVYCVCSLEPEEGETRAQAFLARHPQMRADPIGESEIPPLFASARTDGYLRTRPDLLAAQGGCDGFFIARFIKSF